MNQNANILLCAILADEVHTWSRASRSALEFEASAHYDRNFKIWSKNKKAFFILDTLKRKIQTCVYNEKIKFFGSL